MIFSFTLPPAHLPPAHLTTPLSSAVLFVISRIVINRNDVHISIVIVTTIACYWFKLLKIVNKMIMTSMTSNFIKVVARPHRFYPHCTNLALFSSLLLYLLFHGCYWRAMISGFLTKKMNSSEYFFLCEIWGLLYSLTESSVMFTGLCLFTLERLW